MVIIHYFLHRYKQLPAHLSKSLRQVKIGRVISEDHKNQLIREGLINSLIGGLALTELGKLISNT